MQQQNLKQNSYLTLCSILEPKREIYTPWAEFFAQKVGEWCKKYKFTDYELAEAIRDPSPEVTMKKFSKVINSWEKAQKIGMTVKDFESAGYGLDYELENKVSHER